MTLETNERMLRESREENQCLKNELHSLNQRIDSLTNINQNLANKLEAAENNTVSLERQILELNIVQANHRDANRQEILLNGIKVLKQKYSSKFHTQFRNIYFFYASI